MPAFDDLSPEDQVRVLYVLYHTTDKDSKGRTLDEAAQEAKKDPATALILERYIQDKIVVLTASPQQLSETLRQANELLAADSILTKTTMKALSSRIPNSEAAWESLQLQNAQREAVKLADMVDLHGIQYTPVTGNTDGAKLFGTKNYDAILQEAMDLCHTIRDERASTVKALEASGIDMQCSTVPVTKRQGQGKGH